MYYAGIDIGSMTAETVIINDEQEICSSCIVKSGASHKDALERSFSQALKLAGIVREDIKYIVSTGYGRINVDFADKQVTEIACHGKGAHFLFPETRTVIDIGGQDSKIIKLNKKGKVIDFLMNDKCAAGTGRFLEVMANALGIKVEELGAYSMKSKKPAKISCMCGIFAESEVVSKIANGETKEDIVRGLHNSIASRLLGMVNRVKKDDEVTMTGGGAKNIGVVHAMQEQLQCEINVPADPQIIGALGAALVSREEYYAGKE